VKSAMMILLGVLSACGTQPNPDGNTAAVVERRVLNIQVGKGSDGGSLVEFNDVQIDVARDVTLTLPTGSILSLTSAEGKPILDGHDGPEVLVDGQVLDVLEGELFVDAESFGLITTDDLVLINSAGVWVNGEARSVAAGAPAR
jgi:hypothetical protein